MKWNNTMEIGFLYGFNGFQLVYSMCLEKHDSLPLGLAHEVCARCCHLGFLRFGSAKEESHGGDLQTMRYSCIEFIRLHIDLV